MLLLFRRSLLGLLLKAFGLGSSDDLWVNGDGLFLLIRRSTSRTLAVQLLINVVPAPEADLVAALARQEATIGDV